jgi:uncharacterized membrane protein
MNKAFRWYSSLSIGLMFCTLFLSELHDGMYGTLVYRTYSGNANIRLLVLVSFVLSLYCLYKALSQYKEKDKSKFVQNHLCILAICYFSLPVLYFICRMVGIIPYWTVEDLGMEKLRNIIELDSI